MRITQNQFFQLALIATQKHAKGVVQAQERITAGTKILRPSDDPTGARRALFLQSSLDRVGEYTANVHLYRNEAGGHVPVTVVASVKAPDQQSSKQILASTVELTREGQELTVFRFRLDNSGALVSGSVTNLQKPIRDWRPS